MNEIINITKKELLELLAESFDQGFGGYQELKDSTTKKILNKHIKNNKKENKEISASAYNSSVNITNYNKNKNKNVWATTFSGTPFPIEVAHLPSMIPSMIPSMTSTTSSVDSIDSFVIASNAADNFNVNPIIVYE